MSIGQYFVGYHEMFPLTIAIRMAIIEIMWNQYLSPEEFGDLVGVSASTVRSWRNGRVNKIHNNNMTRLWPIVHDRILGYMHQGLYAA